MTYPYEPQVGDIWRDCDPRSLDRRIEIVRVTKHVVRYRTVGTARECESSRARFNGNASGFALDRRGT